MIKWLMGFEERIKEWARNAPTDEWRNDRMQMMTSQVGKQMSQSSNDKWMRWLSRDFAC